MSQPVTVGLVGCGRWGRVILRDLSALGCAVVVADPDPASRSAAARGGATAVVAEPGELPAVDGIIVATPATTHAAVVGALLDRGVPVFCEKPLTTDVEAARRLAARGAGRLFVMHVWRYHRGVRRLAELAQSGDLGRVLSLRTERKNWTSPRTDTDPVWTLVPHDLTIAKAVFGTIPTPMAARAELVARRPVAMTGILGDAPFAAFDCSTRFREKRREIRLHCEGGVAVLPDPDSPAIEILRPDAPPDVAPVVQQLDLAGEPALLAELRAFAGFLRGGPPPPTDAAEGLAVVEAVAALRRLAGLRA
ncbi:MAG: Gfo/Idh/MocA family oxidoreductase [Bauldia sp.]|nr:Gfo/Idh/MocA family oxidoreductase [Bauldia sp.]